MFLIILGIVIIAVNSLIARPDSALAKFKKAISVVGCLIVLLGAALSMFKVVEAGEVGVKKLYGKVDNDVLYSGLNLVNPLVEVTMFDTKTQNYTMSAIHDEGMKSGDPI